MKPVHFTHLRHMAQSPAHYYQSAHGDGWPDAHAPRIGRGSHALLFDEPVAVYQGKVRRGAAWEQFKADNKNAVWLNPKEHAQASALAEAVRNHRGARELLFADKAVMEQRIEWRMLGRDCAGTPDVRNTTCIVDLKTTKCSNPDRFIRDATWRAYHAQLAWYLDGVALSGLGKPTEAYVVAVESTPPHCVTVMRLTERAIDQGRRLCRVWLERVIGCERDGYWPGYCESVVDFDVDQPLELEFGDAEDEPEQGGPRLVSDEEVMNVF